MFEELFEVLNSEELDSDKLEQIRDILEQEKKYASECGQLR
jgi:hypothetical protein